VAERFGLLVAGRPAERGGLTFLTDGLIAVLGGGLGRLDGLSVASLGIVLLSDSLLSIPVPLS
jgi:hypothetical protein